MIRAAHRGTAERPRTLLDIRQSNARSITHRRRTRGIMELTKTSGRLPHHTVDVSLGAIVPQGAIILYAQLP